MELKTIKNSRKSLWIYHLPVNNKIKGLEVNSLFRAEMPDNHSNMVLVACVQYVLIVQGNSPLFSVIISS